MIVRHQRASASNRGFRQLARYIQGRSEKPRATWFLAANLPGVTGPRDLELACRLVEAVHAQNTRAGTNRTYHLVVSLHPEDRSLDRNELSRVVENLVGTLGFSGHQYIAVRHNDKDHEHVHVTISKIHPGTFRIHSPAWDHQKLFTAGRALELELGLTPLRSRTRDREKVPQRAADHEAHRGIDSFARWAREKLRPALQATEFRSWNDVHDVCGRFGVVIRPHGNGLVFEGVDRVVRVKASFVARELSRASSPRYPWPGATEYSSDDNSRFDKPSKPEPSSESSRSNAQRFKRPGIRGLGTTSLRPEPPSATPARFDLCSDESANATVSARKGSCEIQRDGVEMQFGDPKPKRSALQVDITS